LKHDPHGFSLLLKGKQNILRGLLAACFAPKDANCWRQDHKADVNLMKMTLTTQSTKDILRLPKQFIG
jgi:hypothetical protein